MNIMKKNKMKKPKLVDAQEMAKLYPATFSAPSKKELSKIKKGDSVKVCSGKERFWVTVEGIKKNLLEGVVDNDLVFSEGGLKYGDKFSFSKNNIYQIYE